MFTAVRGSDLTIGAGRTVKFEGEGYGSGVSFFLVDNQPGQGPDLHQHPYSETWVVLEGEVTVTADGEDHRAGVGDILVVGPATPHRFRAESSGTLRMMCIHASPRIEQEFLDAD
ncbi:cupin domain-containing protein [Agromyces albus]|uniref:cupin domain-containing protein n=1 Tax=Agromyces albus TaxID=205332 RepID=UPI002788CEF2|nr:cupin domain-containing protein [Agromyces albus]MDQ0574432.1 mannose-6-phosphate isomerase-like protein (cupin superfamily) [Agromyces albus]